MKSLISRRALVVNGTLGVLLTGGVGLAYVSLGGDGGGAAATSSRTVTVARGTLVSTVSASGSIEAGKSTALSFGASGTVDEIYVKLGQKVKKGQKLARLDQTEALEDLKSAQASLDVADDSDTSTSQGYSTYVQAKNAYDKAVRTLDDTVLTAPYAGTVTAVNGAEGGSSSGESSASTGTGSTSSTSTTSSGFMELSDTSKYKVEGSFTEADTTKLKVGQSAAISFDALTGVTATGKVTDIDSQSTTSNNVVSYTVTITLSGKPAKVRLGQTASAVVTTASKDDALYVPAAAVSTAGGQSSVTVLENGKATVKTVQTGITGTSGTEITSGLEEGDTVQIVTTTGGSSTTNQRGGFGGGGAGGFGGGGTGGGMGGPPGGGR
ncbi:efflux RND transporter periplasmic adaptor subunit [Actinocorallia longicatena]|uniref:HlyD family efflux transporter periplasmic adaptor subunit n=1 Tax=Actinocorallia longicatena TaxID=111803 RepID=A0ABP6QBD7_9ACTN